MKRIYSVPIYQPFLPSFIRGIREDSEKFDIPYYRYLLILPNQRACAEFVSLWSETASGVEFIPKVVSISELEGFSTYDIADHKILSDSHRLFCLISFIQKYFVSSFASALSYASFLVHFLDEWILNGHNVLEIAELVQRWESTCPDWDSTYRERICQFLCVFSEKWSHFLEQYGYMESSRLEFQSFSHFSSLGFTVIAASLTVRSLAIDILLQNILKQEGRIVFYGVGEELSASAWQSIVENGRHPFFFTVSFLSRQGVSLQDVQSWGGVDPSLCERFRFLHQIFSYSDSTSFSEDALVGVQCLPYATLDSEVYGIASILAEGVAQSQVSMLVTSDLSLIRKVKYALVQRGYSVMDTFGKTLFETPQGTFLSEVCHIVASGQLDPVALLSILKHPFFAFRDPEKKTKILRWEKKIFRTVIPAQDEDYALLESVFLHSKLWALSQSGVHLFHEFYEASIELLESLNAFPYLDARCSLWSGSAGQSLCLLTEELSRIPLCDGVSLQPTDFVVFLDALLKKRKVWEERHRGQDTIFLLGPLEARLFLADRVVIGGMNMGVWPLEPSYNPWYLHFLRNPSELDPFEVHAGLSAMDFLQTLSAPEIFFTRSIKGLGKENVPSWWWSNLMVAIRRFFPQVCFSTRYLRVGKTGVLNSPSVEPPAPCPPVEVRPRILSATRIQALEHNPYEIFIRDILKIYEVPLLRGAAPAVSYWGICVHEVLSYVYNLDALHAQLRDQVIQFSSQVLSERFFRPADITIRALQMRNWIETFVSSVSFRQQAFSEIFGQWKPEEFQGDFTIQARADLITLRPDSLYDITDYKTGKTQNNQLIKEFLPQLPLEALILAYGSYTSKEGGVVQGKPATLSICEIAEIYPYIKHHIYDVTSGELLEDYRRKVLELIQNYCFSEEPYIYKVNDKFAGVYDLVARTEEWVYQNPKKKIKK